MKPRILIPLPTSADTAYNASSISNYTEAVREAGGEPVEVPLDTPSAELEKMAAAAQGILLPGSGADVQPSRYGQERDAECADADLVRESVDTQLIEHAEKHAKPLLCICFGVQSLNVHRGGTLVQHLMPMPVNHRAGKAVKVAHAIDVAPESHLGRIVAKDEATEERDLLHLNVNSSHHQAIGVPGDGLRIVARSAEDGVIEAVEDITPDGKQPHWLLGLQWHPERTTDISATSRAIFKDFVSAASEFEAKSAS